MERAGNEELTEDTEKKGLGTPAVSYTHLDVYKRQQETEGIQKKKQT